MADLMDLLKGQLTEGMIDQLSGQLGADKQQTATATAGIMNTLVGALAKNAANTDGANSLANALDKDHDGSILDDLTGYLTGNNTPQNERMTNGAGILNHLLGNKQSSAIDMISKMSGLDSSKTGNLMTTLAPILMGMLGKTKKQEGLDVSTLTSLLNSTVTKQKSAVPEMGLISQFLDADGDGSITDDVMNIGMKMFTNFLRRK